MGSKPWINQKELGKQFNLSAIAVGKKLKEWGLKDANNTPTAFALEQEYALNTPLKSGLPVYLWNSEKVSDKLKEEGFVHLSSPEVRCKSYAQSLISCEKQLERGDDKMALSMQDSIRKRIKAEDKLLVNKFLQELGSDLRVE